MFITRSDGIVFGNNKDSKFAIPNSYSIAVNCILATIQFNIRLQKKIKVKKAPTTNLHKKFPDLKLIIISWDENSYGDIRPQWILLQQNPTKRPSWISYDSQSQSDWHLLESNPHSHRLWERLRGSSLCFMQVKIFAFIEENQKKNQLRFRPMIYFP